MIRYSSATQCGRRRASTLRVKLLWHAEPGTALIPRSICDIDCDVVVENGNAHGHVKALYTGTG